MVIVDYTQRDQQDIQSDILEKAEGAEEMNYLPSYLSIMGWIFEF